MKIVFVLSLTLSIIMGTFTACDIGGPGGNSPVTIAAVQGVSPPVTGGTPATTITETAQFTGTISWSPAVPESGFVQGTQYTATITLTPKAGFTMQNVSANFFTVAGATATNPAGSGTISAVFPPAASTTRITIQAISGINPPAMAGVPATTITETEQFTGTVTWTPSIPAGGTFAPETVYVANIRLTPKQGFTLEGVEEDFFTVAGAETVGYKAGSDLVTALFPQTSTKRLVNIAAIPGLPVPATGRPNTLLPSTFGGNIVQTAQYTVSVLWTRAGVSVNPNTAFTATSVYTANITLTARNGYTLQGIAENFFTVAGATTVLNPAGPSPGSSLTVTAIFPATGSNPVVTRAAIPLPAPAAGATPVLTVESFPPGQYTGTVTWSPAVPATGFVQGTSYTATVTLTVLGNHTLQGVPANFFTVAGGTAVNAANAGVITVQFPSTGATAVSIPVISGVTPPQAGQAPVSTISSNAEFTGTVSWSPNHNPFRAGEVYTATITLTPVSGSNRSLVGVPANFFTVQGATASNPAGQGVVTAVFEPLPLP